MDLSLSPQTLQLIEQRMRKDRYHNADEWMRAALERIEELDELDVADLEAIAIRARDSSGPGCGLAAGLALAS